MTEQPDLEPELARLLKDLVGDSMPGIGVDVEPVERWRGDRLQLDVLFTEAERLHCESKALRAHAYAGLWCAKEAVFKALSPFAAVTLRDIEFEHDTQGRPLVKIHTQELSWLASMVRVSISHTTDLAVAVAVARPEAATLEGTRTR